MKTRNSKRSFIAKTARPRIKQAISLLITVLMIFSAMPMQALAAIGIRGANNISSLEIAGARLLMELSRHGNEIEARFSLVENAGIYAATGVIEFCDSTLTFLSVSVEQNDTFNDLTPFTYDEHVLQSRWLVFTLIGNNSTPSTETGVISVARFLINSDVGEDFPIFIHDWSVLVDCNESEYGRTFKTVYFSGIQTESALAAPSDLEMLNVSGRNFPAIPSLSDTLVSGITEAEGTGNITYIPRVRARANRTGDVIQRGRQLPIGSLVRLEISILPPPTAVQPVLGRSVTMRTVIGGVPSENNPALVPGEEGFFDSPLMSLMPHGMPIPRGNIWLGTTMNSTMFFGAWYRIRNRMLPHEMVTPSHISDFR